jgi:hypothetical protein
VGKQGDAFACILKISKGTIFILLFTLFIIFIYNRALLHLAQKQIISEERVKEKYFLILIVTL